MRLNKDETLDRLADLGNVAQFVAFRPGADAAPKQSYSRLVGMPSNHKFGTLEAAIDALMERASDGALNVRSFLPDDPRSNTFLYGLKDPTEVADAVRRLTLKGLHTIVNETIDIHDGGVSGVSQGDIIEFAPDDTPRCVEKPDAAQMPFELGKELLRMVYGFAPEIAKSSARVEFSIHPVPRGTRGGHTLLWEYEDDLGSTMPAQISWPNRFSRHVGDKAYGLIIAWLLEFPVPRTTVISRRVRPFTFGRDTGSLESWIRTCPVTPEPGLFTTAHGWLDPFALLAKEDPHGLRIASVLSQQAVHPVHAGAAVSGVEGPIIEGKAGAGDDFMLGEAPPESLPTHVMSGVSDLYRDLHARLGDVRFEWVHDGQSVWIVQLHRGGTRSAGNIIVPGDPEQWIPFDVSQGLDALRDMCATISHGSGLELVGHVGLTSHIADVVRRLAIPTRIARN